MISILDKSSQDGVEHKTWMIHSFHMTKKKKIVSSMIDQILLKH